MWTVSKPKTALVDLRKLNEEALYDIIANYNEDCVINEIISSDETKSEVLNHYWVQIMPKCDLRG
jgi:hypothetical protein